MLGRERVCAAVISSTMLVMSLSAQQPVRVRRTIDWSETRQDGQCIIQVMVDDRAEVEFRWDQILVRTLAGQAARDIGTQCNAPLPQGGVRNFQLVSSEGRGTAQLASQPGPENGWAAIIRIQDPESGEAPYKFQLSWTRDATVSQSQGQSETKRGRGAGNLERVCRDAVADRILREWNARVVNYGRRVGGKQADQETWSYGGATKVEGRARISNGSEQREIQYTCSVNVNDRTVQQVDYQFVNDPFSSGRSGGANAAVSVCQSEIRNRVSERHGTVRMTFSDQSRNWGEGNAQRVNGRAQVSDGRGNATIDYNCTVSGNRVDWADFRVLSGSLPGSSFP
jgi:hypothetical protein